MSNIEWTEETWQVTAGCKKVSHGCASCYAETMAKRLRGMAQKAVAKGRDPKGLKPYLNVLNNQGKWDGSCTPIPDNLDIPLKRRTPTVWFVNSMSDLFHEAVPFEFIDRVFAVMALCPQHTFQVLTKRPERMAEYMTRRRVIYDGFSRKFGASKMEKSPCDDVYTIVRKHPGHERDALIWPLPNVWLMTSVENQDEANRRIPYLLRCPALVRGLSCEPLLGPLDLAEAVVKRRVGDPQPDWVIVGGESGPGARTCSVEWIRSIVAQCKAAGVRCFVKQLGKKPYIETCPECGHPEESHATGRTMGCQLCSCRKMRGELSHRMGDPMAFHPVRDPKGGDPAEWPADLRVREMPEVRR